MKQTKKTISMNNSERNWKLFNFYLNRIRKKHKADYLIAGHSHIYTRTDTIIHTGTYRNLDIVRVGKKVIISDAHLKDNDVSLKNKIKMLCNQYGHNLILNGDIFELWLDDPDLVIKKNIDLINTIIRNKCIFIRGNHDYDLDKYLSKKYKFKIYDKYSFKYSGKTYFVCHGWKADPLMNKNIFAKLWYLLWIHIGDNLYKFNRYMLKYRQKIINYLNKDD